MKIFKCLSILCMLIGFMISCKQDIEKQGIPNLCKVKISTYGDFESFDLFGITMISSGASVLYNEEYKKLGKTCELKKDDFKSGVRGVSFLCFDEPIGGVEIITFGIDVIAKGEERKTLMVRIQGYNNGDQFIDKTFTFYSMYDNELPPAGSTLDIDTYRINLMDYF